MKIVQIVGGNEDGGLEKHFIELSNSLSEKFEVYAIANKKYKDALSPKVKFYELDLSKGRNNPIILFKLHSILKEINPNIIHTHANKATHMLSLVKPFVNAKFIATLHSKKSSVKTFCKADFVIAVSEYILNDIKKSCKRVNLRGDYEVIYNGVEFESEKKAIESDSFKIGSIGRLVDVKGFDILLRAFSGIEAKLYILGEGKEEENLKALAKELNLNSRVTFIGMVDNIEEYINSMDLIVIASKREGFSYVFAETLLAKKPLVSTDVADIKKIIGEKFIAPVDDIEILHNKIKYVINNYEDIKKEFEPTFEFASENFLIEKMVEKTVKVYNNILK